MGDIEDQQKHYDAPEAVPPVRPMDSEYPEVTHFKGLNVTAPKAMEVGIGRQRLGDVKASTFWIILGLICALVIGVTVGGVVGDLTLKNNRQAASFSTQTPTSCPSATQSPAPVILAATPTMTPSTDCQNETTYDSLFKSGTHGAVPTGTGLTFTRHCNVDERVDTIATGYFYTFEDGIELCAGLNFWFGNRRCLGVTYSLKSDRPVNFWAHNKTAVVPTTDGIDTAILADE